MTYSKFLEESRSVAYPVELAKALKSIKAAVFISQLFFYRKSYRKNHGSVPEWFFKQQSDFTNDTGMSRREQDTARKILSKAGVLEQKKGQGFKVYYRIVESALDRLMEQHLAEKEVVDNPGTSCTKAPSRVHKSAKPIYETNKDTKKDKDGLRNPMALLLFKNSKELVKQGRLGRAIGQTSMVLKKARKLSPWEVEIDYLGAIADDVEGDTGNFLYELLAV